MLMLVICMPDELCKVFFGEWLYLKDLCKLDSAICQHLARIAFLANLEGSYPQIIYKHSRNVTNHLMIKWVIKRKLRFTKLLIDRWNKLSFTEDELAYLYKPESNNNLQCLMLEEYNLSNPFEIKLFSKFAETLQKLNQLWISWDIDNLDDLVQLVLENSSKLKLIAFEDCKISPTILQCIALYCPSLEVLELIEANLECSYSPAQYYEKYYEIEQSEKYYEKLVNGFEQIYIRLILV